MAGGCVRAECHQWAVSACLNRNDMLTSAVPIYFGTDEETGSSACKAAGHSPSPASR